MSGLFGTFNIAVKGLNANQTALHTTSHNISNANTEGFSRQRVELKADTPYNMPGVGQLGTGVRLQSVVRMVDEFVDFQIRNENSTLSQYETQQDIMGQIEMIFNEPSDTGLNYAMGEMFDSWQELSKNPESLNAKSMVLQKTKSFVDTLSHMSVQSTELKGDVVANIEKNVYDANSILEQLDIVNDQIFNISIKGHSPNDLMDSRDLLLKKLSSLTEFKETYDNGKVTVAIGGIKLNGPDAKVKLSNVTEVIKNEDGSFTVHGQIGGDSGKSFESEKMTAEEAAKYKPGTPVLYNTDAETFEKVEITSGAIGGHLNSLTEIEGRMEELDTFAKGIAYAFNTVHEDGAETIPFFTFDGAEISGNLRINPDIIENESMVNTGVDGLSPAGDGSRALAIANLRTSKFNIKDLDSNEYHADTMKFTSSSAGSTMEGAYGDIIIKIGIKTEYATNMVDNQSAVMAQLSNRRESVSGVSIDEEVTNLLKYQRSYEANSRVINTLNEMLDTLINRTGV